MQLSVPQTQSSPFTNSAQLLSVLPTDTARVSRGRVSERDALEATMAEDTPFSTPSAPDDADRRRRIAERAHALFVARGMADGNDLEDWLEAERQVDAEDSVSKL